MIDYHISSLTADNKFIKKYEVKDGSIITVYFNKNTERFFPFQLEDRKIKLARENKIDYMSYTEEREQEIIKKMHTQVTDFKYSIDSIKMRKRSNLILSILWVTMVLFSFLIPLNIINWFNLLLRIFMTILYTGNYLNDLIKIKNYKKNKLYVENEKEITEKIQNDVRVLVGVSEELKNEVANTSTLSINSIDKYSLKDLKRMVLNIKKIKESKEDIETNNMQNTPRFIKIREFIKK